MNDHMRAKLKSRLDWLAARKCWADDDNFSVEDYAGGNLDDAYAGGERDGETLLARNLLAEFCAEVSTPAVEAQQIAIAERENHLKLIAHLSAALHKVKTRPAEESAAIAAVWLDEAKRKYGLSFG